MKKIILKIISGIVFACVLFVSLSGYVDAISENKPEKTETGEFNETFSGSPALTVNGKPHAWSKKSAALAGGEC